MNSSSVALNLVVIRSSDIDRAAEFYRAPGLPMRKHRHGKGPQHYTAEFSAAVFEIYPLANGAHETISMRLGFRVASVHTAVAVVEGARGHVVSAPREAERGLHAVIEDPDGHRVELTETSAANCTACPSRTPGRQATLAPGFVPSTLHHAPKHKQNR